MKVYQHYQDIPEAGPPSVVTIGVFDGLHLGHQALLNQVAEEACARNLWPVAITFYPHPSRALTSSYRLPLLMPDLYKIQGLSSFGLRYVLRQSFDAGFAALSSDEFSRAVLADRINARLVVVGDDFAFGRNREGNVNTLLAFGKRDGYEVAVIPRIQVAARTVSSTRIRTLLADGDLAQTRSLLGRAFLLSGSVVTGRQRGRKLGFPTANLKPDGMMHPRSGIYVGHTWVARENRAFLSVTNIGTNPTFGQRETTVETHLIDYYGDLLGKRIAVSFLERLRDEVKFPSVEALVAQIRRDVEAARQIGEARTDEIRISALDGDRLHEPVYPRR